MVCSRFVKRLRSAKPARAGALFVGVLVVATGCSKPPPPPPPPPPPASVSLQISAGADANATPQGEGAPVVIRIYQLNVTSAFDGAEFYQLYHADAATLGTDMIKQQELLLSPGASKTLVISPPETVHSIGVFAAYADFQNATWRATADVPAHQATKMIVTADRAGIKLTSTSVKSAAP